jgi:hypothetical protein
MFNELIYKILIKTNSMNNFQIREFWGFSESALVTTTNKVTYFHCHPQVYCPEMAGSVYHCARFIFDQIAEAKLSEETKLGLQGVAYSDIALIRNKDSGEKSPTTIHPPRHDTLRLLCPSHSNQRTASLQRYNEGGNENEIRGEESREKEAPTAENQLAPITHAALPFPKALTITEVFKHPLDSNRKGIFHFDQENNCLILEHPHGNYLRPNTVYEKELKNMRTRLVECLHQQEMAIKPFQVFKDRILALDKKRLEVVERKLRLRFGQSVGIQLNIPEPSQSSFSQDSRIDSPSGDENRLPSRKRKFEDGEKFDSEHNSQENASSFTQESINLVDELASPPKPIMLHRFDSTRVRPKMSNQPILKYFDRSNHLYANHRHSSYHSLNLTLPELKRAQGLLNECIKRQQADLSRLKELHPHLEAEILDEDRQKLDEIERCIREQTPHSLKRKMCVEID